MAANSAALLAAAVRAAVLARAPRRTVQSVAAAVTAVLLRPTSPVAPPATDTGMPAEAPSADGGAREEQLVLHLRAVRAAKRKAKRQRRKSKATAAAADPAQCNDVVVATPAATLTSDKSVPLPGAACGKRKTSDKGDAEMTNRMIGTVLGRQQSAAVQPTTWEEAECVDISSCPLPGGAATSSAGRGGMHAELGRQRPAREAVYPNTWEEAEQLDRRSWSRRAATSANRGGGTKNRAGQPPASGTAVGHGRGKGPY